MSFSVELNLNSTIDVIYLINKILSYNTNGELNFLHKPF